MQRAHHRMKTMSQTRERTKETVVLFPSWIGIEDRPNAARSVERRQDRDESSQPENLSLVSKKYEGSNPRYGLCHCQSIDFTLVRIPAKAMDRTSIRAANVASFLNADRQQRWLGGSVSFGHAPETSNSLTTKC